MLKLSQYDPFLPMTGVGALLVVLVCYLTPVSVQVACVGILVVAVLALVVRAEFRTDHADHFHLLSGPLALARDPELFEFYRSITGSLKETSVNSDPVYRELALERIGHVARELHELAEGRVFFTATETWRMAYARLLGGPGIHLYRSVAHVKTSTYWQDEPGRQSMQVNFEQLDKGALGIERIAILPDHLWPAGERFPVDPLRAWLDEQHRRGVRVKLVRQSALSGDSDLLVDMGIYGTRAVGFQELDEAGHTVRFTLSFDFPEILAAERRWDRLLVYSVPYEKLLEPAGAPG